MLTQFQCRFLASVHTMRGYKAMATQPVDANGGAILVRYFTTDRHIETFRVGPDRVLSRHTVPLPEPAPMSADKPALHPLYGRAMLRTIQQNVELASSHTEELICMTPTSEVRNAMTEANIHLHAARQALRKARESIKD